MIFKKAGAGGSQAGGWGVGEREKAWAERVLEATTLEAVFAED